MTLLNNLPPAFLLIIGALILVILPATARKVGAITLALFGFYAISQLSEESRFIPEFLGYDHTLLRVDSTSKVFGDIFHTECFWSTCLFVERTLPTAKHCCIDLCWKRIGSGFRRRYD